MTAAPSIILPPDDLPEAMREFVIAQSDGTNAGTQARYARVADDLVGFMDGVDVRPWLGPEVAAVLQRERARLGAGAFLPTLGISSLIRVLPAFLAAPWLPEQAQRRTHRTVVRRLLTFLRLRVAADGCLRRPDFDAVTKALGHAYDYGPTPRAAGRDGKVTVTVTLDLVEHLVDRMLEEVTCEEYRSLDEAIAVRLNPVRVTVWHEPEHSPYEY